MQSAADVVRPLFGGAMSAVVPAGATDVSTLREIPDNQEVFVHAYSDQSLIVELVELQSQVSGQDAVRYHFDDIAGSNSALGPGGVDVGAAEELPGAELALTECSCAWVLTGTQRVSKFNEEAKNTVAVHLGMLRLPQFSTDVLVTFNDPKVISPASSSSSSSGSPTGDTLTRAQPWTLQDFERLLRTLTLHDPGLFG